MHRQPQQDRPAVYRINARDNVAVALRTIAPGERLAVAGRPFIATGAIPMGHKVALDTISAGDEVFKYGWPIGRATARIAEGEHVHAHNLVTALTGIEAYAYEPQSGPSGEPSPLTFEGYRRTHGVGTRNEIWILSTVGCVARTGQRIADEAARRFKGRVDGVYAFGHPFGCSQAGDDLEKTRRLLASLAAHPNAGGVLILGLGCETNQIASLLSQAPGIDRTRVRAFNAQDAADEYEDGLNVIADLVEAMGQDRRVPCPLADLVVGLKCGGSDGLSGLTANPLVGRIADIVAGAGGTPILTEIPEIFGAERLLMARAKNDAVFSEIADVVNTFKTYFQSHGRPIHENPSPGNLAGGITTLEEKSLGAVQKAGRATVTQVVRYGERVAGPGLALLESPGNDAVSSTALAAAGATVILFTTGRGTPLGFPAPTLKIATNSELAQRKPTWIDFDAGGVLSAADDADAAQTLMRLVIETASGKPTRAEINGERDIAIWKTGVTL